MHSTESNVHGIIIRSALRVTFKVMHKNAFSCSLLQVAGYSSRPRQAFLWKGVFFIENKAFKLLIFCSTFTFEGEKIGLQAWNMVMFYFPFFPQILIVNEMERKERQAGDSHFSASCSCSLWDAYSVNLGKYG